MKHNLTPKEIVNELDKHIIGQDEAKKSVAIALRNRYRRMQVEKSLRDEIVPKNILMIGPTGCGKTEIARRLAKLADAPFVKVEATKFTEVGYVGRDVDSIIRDLADQAVNIAKKKAREEVKIKAEQNSEERVLNALIGKEASSETREKFRVMLRNGELDSREIEIEVEDNGNPTGSMIDIPGFPGQMGMISITEVIGKTLGSKMKRKKMSVLEAYDILMAEESDKLIDEDKTIKEAINSVENDGIVFLDEIDKISARNDGRSDVSREGVQRDLLPLIEGTVVSTKYGIVKTDHILFIASGAFHLAKPADLLPELQGRLPIRVQLEGLKEEDLYRILSEPEASLTKQYKALMAVDKTNVEFTDDGIKEIARIAAEVNKNVENIGARRLHTIMEKLLEEISFNAEGSAENQVKINAEYVKSKLDSLATKTDLSKFIL
ncbi:MAG: ATP-dependent protease ATPase subunit HslU [Rickettsiales bacterium]|nr:ATP-dependent protease ATPase subunit HslU [Rickettsiales bacterium]